jgi:uncharacterized protein (DUF433 family)
LTVPFVGLAEGFVLAAFRRAGVPLQRIRPALERLSQEVGIEHALASRRLSTDGAEVLYNYAESVGVEDLVVVRSRQRIFTDLIRDSLRLIEYADDGYAQTLRLPEYRRSEVVIDPRRGSGQPIFSHGAARLSDVLALFQAGEDLKNVATEFRVPPEEVEDALRVVASHRAA